MATRLGSHSSPPSRRSRAKMADFSNLKALDVTNDSTAEYFFPDIPGNPSIVLAPATDANKPFQNERLRMSLERAEKAAAEPRGKTSGPQTPEGMANDIEEEREQDRRLISGFCARAWGTAPLDVNGEAPEFSPENCYQFLKSMPDWMFDPLRNFTANVRNFVKRPALSPGQGEALGNF